MIFATIFTPQGDGNPFTVIILGVSKGQICHDIYPARGRKLKIPTHVYRIAASFEFATIFTPQGDGNGKVKHWF